MTDKELEAKVDQLGNEIMDLCDKMEQNGLDDDIAIAEAGMEQAIKDANLTPEEVSNETTSEQ